MSLNLPTDLTIPALLLAGASAGVTLLALAANALLAKVGQSKTIEILNELLDAVEDGKVTEDEIRHLIEVVKKR